MKLLMAALAATCLLSFNLEAKDVVEPSTNESFPSQVTFDHDGKNYNLDITGTSVRKKLIVTVYTIASYVQDAAKLTGDKFADILNDSRAKQLSMKWARDIEAEKIVEGYKESIKTVLTEEQIRANQADVDKYFAAFNHNVKKGDVTDIRYAPGGYVEVIHNGTRTGDFTNPTLAQAIFKIWYGDKSVVDRNKLVSLVK